ncbi:leucine-rich repeat-containing protein let-4-like [Sitodiplosis mosellana]|uniref:leucine-rich repeat-containing protein let-4-like n=1 Tax=Sitodiplosis mosellana TaxID=263140 RepID=UPI002444B62D|nr:leucine-rich repeat-containing protein let-4-like [Sitodiplosis mosellana]
MLYFSAITVVCIWALQFGVVVMNPVTNIECDCSATSLESDSSACCVSEFPMVEPAVRVTFRNVPNTSSIIQVKLHSMANFTEIPSQIIDTFENLEYLELTIGLERLPLTRIPGKLKHLNLSGNRITSVDIDAFLNAPGLDQINLQYNRISTLADSGAFVGPNNLKYLILYHNKLTILKRDMFKSAQNLISLDIGCNEISTIEDGTFDLPHIKEILMSENKLKTLSDQIFNGAPSVQNIDLQKNLLDHIGKAFETTTHLHQLQLSENHHLHDLNVMDLTSKLPELISLSVDATGIQSLSTNTATTSITTQSTTSTSIQSPLHTLSISQNHLSQSDFLKQLSAFSKLEKLFVDANKFTRWDDADVRSIKKYFPNIELIVTKNNVWDRRWVESTLIPVFQTNNIFCSNIKYLNTYIEGFTNSIDGQIIEGTECI